MVVDRAWAASCRPALHRIALKSSCPIHSIVPNKAAPQSVRFPVDSSYVVSMRHGVWIVWFLSMLSPSIDPIRATL